MEIGCGIPLLVEPTGQAALDPAHVSLSGSDSNSGTSSSPWLTIKYAMDQASVRGIHTITVHGNQAYYQNATLSYNNLPIPFTLQAAAGDIPIISGGLTISGFVPDVGSIQKATGVTTLTRNLWVNGTRCTRASHVGGFSNQTANNTGFSWGGNNNPIGNYARPGDVELVFKRSNFVHSRLPVASVTASAITMVNGPWTTAIDWLGGNATTAYSQVTSWENAYELMGTEGQFYRNNSTSTLYYTPRSGTRGKWPGTEVNTPTYTADAPAATGLTHCLAFVGASSQRITSSYAGPQAASARTFAVWLKSATTGDIVAYGTEGATARFEWGLTSATNIYLATNASNIHYTIPSLNDGSWHHVAIVVPLLATVAQVLIYVDGVLQTTIASSTNTGAQLNTGSANKVYFASYFDNSLPLTARASDFRAYDTDLTAAQITALVAGTDITSREVLRWKMDENSGTTALDSAPPDAENLATATVVIGNLATIFDLTNCNVTFSGITFSHTTWNGPADAYGLAAANGCRRVLTSTPTGSNATYSVIPAAVQCHGGTPTFSNCTFSHLGGVGLIIDTAAASPVVAGCVFNDISSGGIVIGDNVDSADGAGVTNPSPPAPSPVTSASVHDNYFVNWGQEYETCHAICALYTSQGHSLVNNEIANGPYSGTHLRGLRGNQNANKGGAISNNFYHDCMNDSGMGDGAHFYTNGWQSGDSSSTNGLTATGNAFFTPATAAGDAGQMAYLDNVTAGISFTANLTNDVGTGVQAVKLNEGSGGGNNTVTGNTFAGNTTLSGGVAGDVITPNTYSTTPDTGIIGSAGITANYQSINRNVIDDTFTYTDGTDLTTKGWTAWEQGAWTAQSGKAQVIADFAFLVRDKGNLTQTISEDIATTNLARLPGIVARLSDSNNFVFVGPASATQWKIWTVKAGVITAVKTITLAFAINTTYTLKVYVVGNHVFVYVGGVYQGRYDGLDSAINGTFCGLGVAVGIPNTAGAAGTVTFDNFTVTSP